jgi:hypothetical protein
MIMKRQICIEALFAHRALFDCSLRSLRCSLGCRRLRQIWRNGKALSRQFLLHTARRWGWCSLRSRNLFEIGGANIENPPPFPTLAA